MTDEAKSVPPQSPVRALINLLPLLILTWYLCNNGPSKNPNYQLEACAKNLKLIGVGLEKDRLTSESKLYNKDLESVLPKGKFPTCPGGGGKESYLTGYQLSTAGDSYVLVCKGSHHTEASVPSDYPRIAFSVEEAKAKNEGLESNKKADLTSSPTPAVESSPQVQESPQPSSSPQTGQSQTPSQVSPSPAASVSPSQSSPTPNAK